MTVGTLTATKGCVPAPPSPPFSRLASLWGRTLPRPPSPPHAAWIKANPPLPMARKHQEALALFMSSHPGHTYNRYEMVRRLSGYTKLDYYGKGRFKVYFKCVPMCACACTAAAPVRMACVRGVRPGSSALSSGVPG